MLTLQGIRCIVTLQQIHRIVKKHAHIGATFIMVFSPPESLTGTALVIWMAVAIIGFYSAMTVFFVPHLSLGAELSTSYHERSRLFGVRHGFYTFGSILSLISFYLLISAEQEGRDVVRAEAFDLALLAAAIMVGTIAWTVQGTM